MKKICTLLVLLTVLGTASAQKSIRELADLPDKKFDKLLIEANYADQMPAFVKNYESQTGKDLPDPVVPQLKKVALLSYFTADFSQIDVKAYQKGGVYESYITGDGGKILVTEFYKLSIDELKKVFATQGMELLTPDEYLKTAAQRQIYEDYEVEVSKLTKGASKLGNYFSKSSSKSLVAVDGYRPFPAATAVAGGDMRAVRDLGKLAKELGVDGFLSVQTLTQKEKKEIGLKGITMVLHSPNPVPDDPAINYGLGFYYEGILVGSVGFDLEEYMQFAELPKKATNFQGMNLDGYSELISRMAKKLIGSIEGNYASGGKATKRR